jgi:hypothetical protein
MTRLRQRMLDDLRRRNYSPDTIRGYIRAVRQFAEYFGRSPEQMGAEELRRYQIHLLHERKLALGTVENCISALRFLYRVAVPRLLDRRHRPWRRRLPEHPLPAHRRRHGSRLVLLRYYRLHPRGARALGEHVVCRLPAPHARIAMHDYLPHVFMIRGRRLLYSHGVYALVGFTALLLIVFGGVTDRLIPLFAIGAFLAFTLSQAGMVMHWKRQGGKGSLQRMIINGVGAFATGVTLLVVLVAKFTEGAWITAILIPALIVLMSAVKRHYNRVSREIVVDCPMRIDNLAQPLVVVPLDRWTRITEKGLRFALKISDQVQAVHVDAEECCDEVRQMWQRNVVEPMHESGKTVPELILLSSPYRFVIAPLVEYILKVERDHPDRQIAVLVPETRRQTLVADSAPQPAPNC